MFWAPYCGALRFGSAGWRRHLFAARVRALFFEQGEQLREGHREGLGKPSSRRYSDCLLAALNGAHVGAVDANAIRKLFLRVPGSLTQAPDERAELSCQGRFIHALKEKAALPLARHSKDSNAAYIKGISVYRG